MWRSPPSWPPSTVCRCLSGDTPAHLLVLAQRLLFTCQACSLLCIWLVCGGDLVGLRPRLAAHLAAGPCGLVDEGTARALPAHLGQKGYELRALKGQGRVSQGCKVWGQLTGGGSGAGVSGCPCPGSWGGPGFGGASSSGPLGCSVRSLKPRSGKED